MTLVDLPSSPLSCRNNIGGDWKDSRSTQVRSIKSPYTSDPVSTCPLSVPDDLDEAVQLANQAFPEWKAMTLKDRAEILSRFRRLLLENLRDLSHLAAREAGKTVPEAKAGIEKGIEVLDFAICLQNFPLNQRQEVGASVWCHSSREPIGVVAGITPFNFPVMVPLWMFPIALALGNCFILKPSEKVPSAATFMTELLYRAGLPMGVFSLLHGDREIVDAIVEHPGIQAIGFVGSSRVAESVYAAACLKGKRALCLGGAKNQIIITPDADPAITIKSVVDSFTGCGGQRCMAGSVLIAVGDVSSLLNEIASEARKRALGINVGAIIDRESLDRIHKCLEKAVLDGASIIVDGRKSPPPQGYEKGNWIGPTIIDDAHPKMECATVEIFGPVLTVLRVPTVARAMELDKSNPYGNATSVFTTSGAVASYVSEHATAGMVGINIGVPVPREPFSFGGRKGSRFGYGDITGPSAVEFWTDLKKVTTKWTGSKKSNWMS